MLPDYEPQDDDIDNAYQESCQTGKIKYNVIASYLKSYGTCGSIFILLLFFITQIMVIGSDYWPFYWLFSRFFSTPPPPPNFRSAKLIFVRQGRMQRKPLPMQD
jgi:hypothetical protein